MRVLFQGLDSLAHKHGISFLIDEVQTGGGSTGKIWCHEHFDLEHGPDIMTFSKKMISGGIYHKKSHRPKEGGRILNTWMGDPDKIIKLAALAKIFESERLEVVSARVGEKMLAGLMDLTREFPGAVKAARGMGTFCAIDCNSAAESMEIKSRYTYVPTRTTKLEI